MQAQPDTALPSLACLKRNGQHVTNPGITGLPFGGDGNADTQNQQHGAHRSVLSGRYLNLGQPALSLTLK